MKIEESGGYNLPETIHNYNRKLCKVSKVLVYLLNEVVFN